MVEAWISLVRASNLVVSGLKPINRILFANLKQIFYDFNVLRSQQSRLKGSLS